MTPVQAPLPSGFGPSTTSAEVMAGVALDGKIAIVTGGYSGLGLETVRKLRAAGAEVVVPARDVARARQALGALDVEIAAMDLLDPASIDRFAAAFLASGRPLHLLINSAAIMALPERTLDARGYELQFATNHLGHFQLTTQLWPALLAARGARVVSVSSLGHRYSPVVFDDPHFARRAYAPFSGYGQSKTANVLFAVALDARGRDHGVRAFSVHPGAVVETNLGRHVPLQALRDAGVLDADDRPVIDPSKKLKTVEMGAATQLWCAVSPQLAGRGGVYCEDVDVAPLMPERDLSGTDMRDVSRLTGVISYAVDAAKAEQLWTLSEQLIGRSAMLSAEATPAR